MKTTEAKNELFSVNEAGEIFVEPTEDHTGYVGKIRISEEDGDLIVSLCDSFLISVLENGVVPVSCRQVWKTFCGLLRSRANGNEVWFYDGSYGQSKYLTTKRFK